MDRHDSRPVELVLEDREERFDWDTPEMRGVPSDMKGQASSTVERGVAVPDPALQVGKIYYDVKSQMY